MTKLFICNIDYKATKDEIAAHFAAAGVRAFQIGLVRDKETRAPKGYGFCLVDDAAAAMKLDGSELRGRALKIEAAREQVA